MEQSRNSQSKECSRKHHHEHRSGRSSSTPSPEIKRSRNSINSSIYIPENNSMTINERSEHNENPETSPMFEESTAQSLIPSHIQTVTEQIIAEQTKEQEKVYFLQILNK